MNPKYITVGIITSILLWHVYYLTTNKQESFFSSISEIEVEE